MTTQTGLARRALWGVVAVLGLVAGACSDGEDPEDATTTSSTIPPAQTLLRVGVEAWPACLNPVTCDSPALREQVLQHVLPVVFEVDAENEFRASPLMAAEPEADVSGSGMTVTYRLHSGAHWNDGRPITSSDLRGTWQAVLATPGADTTGYDRITAIDDSDPLVAVATFASPYGDWKRLFGGGRGWVLQADAFGADLDLTDRFEDELPFSAAPYRLAAWDADGAVLAAVEDYWAEERRPAIDQVRLARVDIGELEDPRAFDILIPSSETRAAPPGFDVRRLRTTSVVGIWFDQRFPLLASLENRQALAGAIDRVEVSAAVVDEDDFTPIDCLGWLPGVGPWCEAAAVELPEQNRDLARFALALTGWAPSPDGTLVRGTEAFAVPVVADPTVPGTAQMADAVVDAFAAIGVGAERFDVSSAVWRAPRPVGESTGVGVFALDVGISPLVDQLYGCRSGVTSSVIAWCPEGVVADARALSDTVDPERAIELVDRIGTAAGENVAWLPLVQGVRRSFVRADRVVFPEAVPVIGGPLAHLSAFDMDG